MPALRTFEIDCDCSPAELAQRLRRHVRRSPTPSDVRLPRDQHFSFARPWIGDVSEGRVDLLRQSLNPRSGESRVVGTISAKGGGSSLRMNVQISWGVVFAIAVLAMLALGLFVPELAGAKGDRLLVVLIPMCIFMFAGPLVLWAQTRRIEHELRAMLVAEPAAAENPVP